LKWKTANHGLKDKSLVLIARGEHNKAILAGQLENLIGDKVMILGLCLETFSSKRLEKLDPDLLVVSTKAILNKLPEEVTGSTKLLIARRSINYSMIYKLISLPANSKIMVVNDQKESAEETVSLLYQMGFRSLRLVPVYPGMKRIPEIDVAITPGESHLVPKGVRSIIDIGTRTIDLSTMIEILVRLNLLDEKANFLSARYVSEVLNISRRLAMSLNEIEDLNNLMETIINNIGDGIVAVNKDDRIRVFNDIAGSIFNMQPKDVIDALGKDKLPFLDVDKPLREGRAEYNSIERHCGHDLIVNRIPLIRDGKKEGAVLTLIKPGDIQKIEQKLRVDSIKKGHTAKYTFDDIVSKSRQMQELIARAKNFAVNNSSILILGETGTGKELLASAIHNKSYRKKGPFVAVNCAALPKDLLESELFGYTEGAFTGAKKGGKVGFFEQAHKGTIFLDEIGDMSIEVQMRLLRVLQEKEIVKIGGESTIPIDVRVIAATNRKLRELMEERTFRPDLYYRINTFTLYIPPLRQRKDDIMLLIEYFLIKYNADMGSKYFFAEEVIDFLKEYPWPGNVRELENVIEYVSSVVKGRKVEIEDLPIDLVDYYLSLKGSGSNNGIKYQSNNALEEFVKELKGSELKEYISILRLLSENTDGSTGYGRKRLAAKLNDEGLYLTEDIVRRKLEVLSSNGFIETYKGRRGSVITEKGITLVDYIDSITDKQ
jgi:transcriptional regulator with PAS, ATPase and Fis domain